MKFIIPGAPLAKMRHRTKGRITYDPQAKEKEAVRVMLSQQITSAFTADNPIIVKEAADLANAEFFTVDLEFHCPAPKSDPWGLKPCNTAKDVDNAAKFYLDAANGILYSDDHKIVALSAKKVYHPIPKTILYIMPEHQDEISNDIEQVLKQFEVIELQDFIDDVWCFTSYHVQDISEMPQDEWVAWRDGMAQLIASFSLKWAAKIQKIHANIKKNHPKIEAIRD